MSRPRGTIRRKRGRMRSPSDSLPERARPRSRPGCWKRSPLLRPLPLGPERVPHRGRALSAAAGRAADLADDARRLASARGADQRLSALVRPGRLRRRLSGRGRLRFLASGGGAPWIRRLVARGRHRARGRAGPAGLAPRAASADGARNGAPPSMRSPSRPSRRTPARASSAPPAARLSALLDEPLPSGLLAPSHRRPRGLPQPGPRPRRRPRARRALRRRLPGPGTAAARGGPPHRRLVLRSPGPRRPGPARVRRRGVGHPAAEEGPRPAGSRRRSPAAPAADALALVVDEPPTTGATLSRVVEPSAERG